MRCWLFVALLFVCTVGSPAFAACTNALELLQGTIVDFDTPFPKQLSNGKHVVLQNIYLETELDSTYDLPGRTAGNGERLLVVVCDRNLDFPGRSAYVSTLTDCEDPYAAAMNLVTTEVWNGAFYGPGGRYHNGVMSDVTTLIRRPSG